MVLTRLPTASKRRVEVDKLEYVLPSALSWIRVVSSVVPVKLRAASKVKFNENRVNCPWPSLSQDPWERLLINVLLLSDSVFPSAKYVDSTIRGGSGAGLAIETSQLPVSVFRSLSSA